jgi:hypothetical protein
MTNRVRLLVWPGLMLAVFLHAPFAHAQANLALRTWISGTGDDANSCSRTAPCRTFFGAITKTASGGEIDMLDPTRGGTLNITKPITIDGGTGVGAAVLASGVDGIAVQPGSGAVILRNLKIFSTGNGFGIGLDTTGGGTASVVIDRSTAARAPATAFRFRGRTLRCC